MSCENKSYLTQLFCNTRELITKDVTQLSEHWFAQHDVAFASCMKFKYALNMTYKHNTYASVRSLSPPGNPFSWLYEKRAAKTYYLLLSPIFSERRRHR
jgi:hypothetical protein